MEYGAMEADAVRQQQGEDRALQYCNYIFEIVLNVGTTFGFQAVHRSSSLTANTAFGATSRYVPSSIYVVADHLSRALLDDVAARLCITDKLPLDLAFREAVWTVHAKFQAGYVRWTQQLLLPMRPVCQQVIDPSTRYTDDSVIRLLLSETALLLLLHTEASILQQIPSSCSLLYWLLRFSIHFKQAVESAPLLSQASVWAVPWNNRDMILEVHTAAADLLSYVGQPALAEVEREWASRKDAARQVGRVLSNLVSRAAAGQLSNTLTAQEALRVVYVFSMSEAAVMLEEVLQPLQHLLLFLESELQSAVWEKVCHNIESRLQHPSVLHKVLSSLSVVDCHCVADTFQALRDLGQHADGTFDAQLAAVWWQEVLMSNGTDTLAAEARYPFGTTWHLMCAAFLIVQGTFAVTISLGASKDVSVCRNPEQTSCISATGLAWSSLLLSHAALRLIEAIATYYSVRRLASLPRLTDTLPDEICIAAQKKITHLPMIVPMGLKGVKDVHESHVEDPQSWKGSVVSKAQTTFNATSDLLHSLWGAGIWFATMTACFGLLFVRGTVGEVFEMAWWIIAVTHSLLVALTVLHDWYLWRQSSSARPLPSSFVNKTRGFLRGLFWLGAVFGIPLVLLWLLSLPSHQALERILWYHINRQRTAVQRPWYNPHPDGGLVMLAMGALSTNMLGGVIFLVLLSMAIRVALWAKFCGLKIPLRSQTIGKWEELCGCFDQLAETWCAKCLPNRATKDAVEEDAVTRPNAGRFPVVWNGLVDNLVQRDLLASSEGETLAYTRIINVTTPSLLSSLGLPDMMPPAFVIGPCLHQWLQKKANPMAVVTLPIVQVLRLLLLLMHHADVLTTGELIVMSLAVEEGKRVPKRQHVAIKHILVEGMKIISWAYKGGIQPDSDWMTMVKKHSRMTDAIFNYICAFELGVAPSAATAGELPPQSPTKGTPPKEASSQHVSLPRTHTVDSADSMHGRKSPRRRAPPTIVAVDKEDSQIMDSKQEAHEEAAKVTSLISKQLPALKTKSSNADNADQGEESDEPATPTCSELEFGGGMYTPRSTSGDSDSSHPATPRSSHEKSPRAKRKKKGQDTAPPPPLVARLLRRTMGKSQYFMALSLYMVKLRRTPNWSKSEPEVPAAADELLSFMESVFHPAFADEPPLPALAAPSLTSVLPLLPGQMVVPFHLNVDKKLSGKQEEPQPRAPGNVYDPNAPLFTSEGRVSSYLDQLIKRHLPEWQNFQERIAAMTGLFPVDVRPTSFMAGGRLQHLQWEFLMWVGQRSNSLAHQIQVLAAIHRATPTLLSAERPLSLAVGPKVYAMWLEAVADLKFQAMVLAPHLIAHIHSDDPRHQWNAQAVAVLLNRYSFIRAVSEHREPRGYRSQASHSHEPCFSVLLKGRHKTTSTSTPDDDAEPPSKSNCFTDTTSTEMVAVYMVRLPVNPYASDLSSNPHPHSCPITSTVTQSATMNSSSQTTPLVRPFIFTEYMQTCSLPMANLGLAPALLIRNMLNELYCNDTFTNVFMGSITSVTVPAEPPPSIQLGEASSLRNWVTHSIGSFAPDTGCDVMSVSEVSMQDFATMGTPNPRTPHPGTAIASPSVMSLQRTPSVVSSSNFSLIMQVNQGNNTFNNNVSSQAGSPLSTPKFAGSTWHQRTFDTDTSSVARESLQGRDDQFLQTRDISTPRSQISLADFHRSVRQSHDMETPTLLPPEAFASPTSPDRTLDDQIMSSACVVTPRPFKLFERTVSQGSNTPDGPSFSLPPPGPSALDTGRTESGILFGRTESAKHKLPSVKTSAKPPTPLTPSTSFNRSKDPALPTAQSSIASLRMAATASVSGVTEPETATASVITINSAVPHYESSMHFIPPDTSAPVLSSAASVVEQRFVLAASSSSSWAGFVTGQFMSPGTTPTRRYLAALANLLCLPAQAVGWQPAALCFVDKTWEMSHMGTVAGKGVAAYNACGWICRYIMVDILGPDTLQELAGLLSQLLHGSGLAWLCQEGQETALWLWKVLEMHVRATLWCVCLLPLFVGLRALVELITIPSGWVHSLSTATPAFFQLSAWDSESSNRTWVGFILSLTGFLLAIPILQLYVVRQLHGWAAARQASSDMFASWLPASITLLASAITCAHSSTHVCDLSAVDPMGTDIDNSSLVLGIGTAGTTDDSADDTGKDKNNGDGLKPGTASVLTCGSGLSVHALAPQHPTMPFFISLFCRWGRPLWMTAVWLALLGGLVLSVHGAPLRPMSVFTVVTAGVVPLVFGLLLLVVPHCLSPVGTWELADAMSSLKVWMQWMAESLGSNTQLRSWESMHDAYDAMWDPTVLTWLGQLVGLGLATACMSWFGVQAIRGLNLHNAHHTSARHEDLLGEAFHPVTSQSMFVGEIITRGVLVWAAQALLGLICSLAATKTVSSHKLASLKWSLSLILAISPVALITACYFPVIAAPATAAGSFAVLFILVVCNAAAAGFVTFVLGSVPHMLPWSAAQHICWLGDLWVGIAGHVVWSCLTLVVPIMDFICKKLQAISRAFRGWSTRTSPTTDQLN